MPDTITTQPTGAVSDVQADLLRRLTPYLTRGMEFLGGDITRIINMLPSVGLSAAETGLPGATRSAYDPLARGLSFGVNRLVNQAQTPLPQEGLDAMRASVQRALGRGESPMTADMRNLGAVASSPVPAFGRDAVRLGAAGESLTGAPLDTAAVLDPLQRAFTQTIAPEIRGAAMRAGVPGGGGEQDLMSRAAGDFGRQAAVGLSQQELARRGQGLQGLTQSGNLLQSMINTEQARRALGISGEQVGGQFELGQMGEELGRLGLASQTGVRGSQLDLARRGQSTSDILAAGGLGQTAAQAQMAGPTAEANLGESSRNLDIWRNLLPIQLVEGAMGRVPNAASFPTGTQQTQRPSNLSTAGAILGSIPILNLLTGGRLGNMFGGGGGGSTIDPSFMGGTLSGLIPFGAFPGY